MTFSKSSLVSMPILANSTRLLWFFSEIIGPNHILTTVHCKYVRRYLRIVGGLILTTNFRVTRHCNSTQVSSSFSLSCWSMYSAISLFIFKARPHRGLSSRQFCSSQWKIHFLTVVQVVSLPSVCRILTMEKILCPCIHKLTMRCRK